MRRFSLVVTSTVLSLLFPQVSWSANIPITNPGFESNIITSGTFQVIQPTGWTLYDPFNIINNVDNAVGLIYPDNQTTFFSTPAPEGNNAALIYLAGSQNGEVGIEQTLTDTLQANTYYTLTVQVGNIDSGTSIPGSSDGGGIFFNLKGFPGYRIDLLAGNTVIASDNNSIGATIPEGEFRLATLTFETGTTHSQVGQPLGIRLVNLDLPGSVDEPNIEVDFDDVVLNATPVSPISVPEHSSISSLIFWIIGMSSHSFFKFIFQLKKELF